MDLEKGKFLVTLVLVLAIWAIVASSAAVYYYSEYVKTTSLLESLEASTVKVNIIIDYGNNTVQEFRDIILDVKGATALNALMAVAKVEYTVYPFGVFVDSINSVENSMELSCWWLYSIEKPDGEEVSPEVGADQYRVSNGDTVVWRYTKLEY
ncbi:DUF4430 domain-containing protein [Candidatus Bathyarchaeota archaeon]|nr:DUF4430 domain-containing protein [Candidatus Bathyarchaeota archaeon]MBS7613644.1 DUF4430 domain-containing protein [Candidatus Bathyarchaeota archaeon]MBS7617594.1 DUF4430 domain-containing protein [Candidatus Bathyarchaeota archaeon]